MSDENFEIGRWGKERQKFMTENYLAETAELMAADRWNELALEIDREAGRCGNCSASSTQRKIHVRLPLWKS